MRTIPTPASSGSGLTAPVNAGDISSGVVSNTEFDTLNGVTSAIQSQIDAKAAIASVLAVQELRA